jgi:hypothetical protein
MMMSVTPHVMANNPGNTHDDVRYPANDGKRPGNTHHDVHYPALEWRNSVLVEPGAAVGNAALKQEDGPELQVHGSENLIQTLLRHNLVDLYRLWIFPVVIGSGKRLFAEGTVPAGLKLVDGSVSSTGVVIATYVQLATSSRGRSRWSDRRPTFAFRFTDRLDSRRRLRLTAPVPAGPRSRPRR